MYVLCGCLHPPQLASVDLLAGVVVGKLRGRVGLLFVHSVPACCSMPFLGLWHMQVNRTAFFLLNYLLTMTPYLCGVVRSAAD